MIYYAHTAEGENGRRLAEEHWQPLAQQLERFALRGARNDSAFDVLNQDPARLTILRP